MADWLSYESAKPMDVAQARRLNWALSMSVYAVICILIACTANMLAKQFKDHRFEYLNLLWLPSLALVVKAFSMVFKHIGSGKPNWRITSLLVFCTIHILLFVFWGLVCSSGGK